MANETELGSVLSRASATATLTGRLTLGRDSVRDIVVIIIIIVTQLLVLSCSSATLLGGCCVCASFGTDTDNTRRVLREGRLLMEHPVRMVGVVIIVIVIYESTSGERKFLLLLLLLLHRLWWWSHQLLHLWVHFVMDYLLLILLLLLTPSFSLQEHLLLLFVVLQLFLDGQLLFGEMIEFVDGIF